MIAAMIDTGNLPLIDELLAMGDRVRFESQSADVAAGDVRAFAVKRPELRLHLWMKRGDDGAHLRASFLHRSWNKKAARRPRPLAGWVSGLGFLSRL
jgi:hypothetical protein